MKTSALTVGLIVVLGQGKALANVTGTPSHDINNREASLGGVATLRPPLCTDFTYTESDAQAIDLAHLEIDPATPLVYSGHVKVKLKVNHSPIVLDGPDPSNPAAPPLTHPGVAAYTYNAEIFGIFPRNGGPLPGKDIFLRTETRKFEATCDKFTGVMTGTDVQISPPEGSLKTPHPGNWGNTSWEDFSYGDGWLYRLHVKFDDLKIIYSKDRKTVYLHGMIHANCQKFSIPMGGPWELLGGTPAFYFQLKIGSHLH